MGSPYVLCLDINSSFVNVSEAVPNDLLGSHDPELVAVLLCDGDKEE